MNWTLPDTGETHVFIAIISWYAIKIPLLPNKMQIIAIETVHTGFKILTFRPLNKSHNKH